jgi:phage shock protein E
MTHWLLTATLVAGSPAPRNPNIDMEAYLRVSQEAAAHRETRRLTEDDFIRLSREPGTIVLDARSAAKYDELHVKGAVNLSFPDITLASLAQAIPDAASRVLIYCNNNFENAEAPFPTKRFDASLNLSTYIALYTYGYRNIYELGPLVDIAESKLTFEGTEAANAKTAARSPKSPAQ